MSPNVSSSRNHVYHYCDNQSTKPTNPQAAVFPTHSDPATNSSRRNFLGKTLKLGAGSILIGASPGEWRFGEEKISCHWEEPSGANPMRM
jgi:hypothetical protein